MKKIFSHFLFWFSHEPNIMLITSTKENLCHLWTLLKTPNEVWTRMQYYTEKDNISSKEDTQTINRHLQRCKIRLPSWPCQGWDLVCQLPANHNEIYNLTPVKMAIIQKTTNTKCEGDYGEETTLLHWHRHWKRCGGSSKPAHRPANHMI